MKPSLCVMLFLLGLFALKSSTNPAITPGQHAKGIGSSFKGPIVARVVALDRVSSKWKTLVNNEEA